MSTSSATSGLASSKHDQEFLFCACVMASPDIAISQCSWLPTTAFTDKRLAGFWSDVRDTGDPIKSANDRGLTTELVKWVNRTPNVTTPDVYARGIAEHKYYLDVLVGNSEIAKAAFAKDKQRIKDKIEELQAAEIYEPVKKSTSAELDDELGQVLDGNYTPYVKSYIPSVDNELGGFYGGDAFVLAARPGMGKTALMSVIGRNVSFSGKKVYIFSLEMKKVQLWSRMICGHVGYEWKNVRIGNIDDYGKQKIRDLSAKMRARMGDNFTIIDDVLTPSGIIQACLDGRPDFVEIDHLGELEWENKDDPEVKWYGEAVRMFRTYIAKRLNIPVMIIHQLSREVENRPNKRPILKDLRWSGEIEQRGDVIGFLYREDYYDDYASPDVVPCELIIRKNRQGNANMTIMLEYNLKKQDFKSWIGGVAKKP